MFCAVDIIVDNYYLLWSSASKLNSEVLSRPYCDWHVTLRLS